MTVPISVKNRRFCFPNTQEPFVQHLAMVVPTPTALQEWMTSHLIGRYSTVKYRSEMATIFIGCFVFLLSINWILQDYSVRSELERRRTKPRRNPTRQMGQ